MSFTVRIFSLPKGGNEPHENQDACWPRIGAAEVEHRREVADSSVVAALADGATEGLLSELWARILVARAARTFPTEELSPLLERSHAVWARFKARQFAAGRALTRLPDWLEEPGLENGAFATLAALFLQSDGCWSTVAVGDSCLFQIRNDEVQMAWPISNSEEFSRRPFLICSEAAQNVGLEKHVRRARGKWVRQDRFLIMSDALACWFFQQTELGAKPWRLLLDPDFDGNFQTVIEHLRAQEGLRNDDTTLIRIDPL